MTNGTANEKPPGGDASGGGPGEGAAGAGPGDPAQAAELLALLDAERARAVRALAPDPRFIYAVWGTSWFVGFLALWLAFGDGPDLDVPIAGAAVLFGVCIAGAIAVTIVHVTRRTAGLRGESSRVGALYGWAWFLALGTQTVILNAAYRHGLPEELNALLWPVLSGLVVGTLYLAGGALWQDGLQYGLGVWILVASAAGSIAGYPGVYLVMCLAGGGGFLVAAAYFTVRMRRAAA